MRNCEPYTEVSFETQSLLIYFYFEISIKKVPLHQQHDPHLENRLSHFVILNKVILNQKPKIFLLSIGFANKNVL